MIKWNRVKKIEVHNKEISETHAYSIVSFDEEIVKDVIKDEYDALEERGYNPINQLVGYIMSGDPGYISSHKEARNKITKIERNKILEVILREYIKRI